ncbi:MAG TPA: FAD-dependent oxidoreductase [Planctomycetes bacterium]|nr:FAD-dependent oxidoreductase [Planctomycetota bacterium]
MDEIREPERMTPVAADVDVCVIGGSCTGVFAAAAAARSGATAAVIEANGFFGGMATAALVSIWHSFYDTEFQRKIIGGLTGEVVERLKKRRAVHVVENNPHMHIVLHTDELVIELDELVKESGIRPFLHTRFVRPHVEDGAVKAAIIEDKTGRRAVKARVFIDASGDGDLIARVPFGFRKLEDIQPPTTCAVLGGIRERGAASEAIRGTVFAPEFHGRVPHGFMWTADVVGEPDRMLFAGTRVPNADCSDADGLTRAEMEGRRQVRAVLDIVRERAAGLSGSRLARLPAMIGVRETRHACCLHTLSEQEVLNGVRFDDAIANGSYRVDVHHSDKPGLTFRYLDGREDYIAPGQATVQGRWRPEQEANPTFYQIPYRSLVPLNSKNVLVAGRLIDADRGAYGAVRVMVNCNQTGEAAGVAAALMVSEGVGAASVDSCRLRAVLERHGAIML